MPNPEGNVKPGSLSRARLVEEALALVGEEGLDALAMRRLAERLGVKPASLYWHVRDRGELVELLAGALLDEVRLPRAGEGWRADALAACRVLAEFVGRRRDAARILLEAPEALERSEVQARIRSVLEAAGLPLGEAQGAATMMLVHVLLSSQRGASPGTVARPAEPASIAVDTGSRGVTLRAGEAMSGLVRVAAGSDAPAPAFLRGDAVAVRRLRGAGRGTLELNPDRPWYVRVQAPTWNTALELAGLDVREIQVDSGATRVECSLPPPRGAVPVKISGGVVGVRLRRPPGVKAVAEISTAALQLRLDDFSVGAATSDLRWESAGPPALDRYEVTISGGAVRVSIEEDGSLAGAAAGGPGSAEESGDAVSGPLELVLDGVESRLRRG